MAKLIVFGDEARRGLERVQNAASIAALFLTTEVLVADKP